MIKKFFIIPLLLSQMLSAQLSWPGISKENKPWTRMWWPGSIATKADLTYAMEKYKAAGLGGLEVTCIYGVKGEEEKFNNYLSPEWMELFTYILKEGKRLGLGIDLANASGWPFGGPWVEPSDACRNINYKTWSLKEGETITEKIEFIQQPLVRAVGQKPDINRLTDPIASNANLQLYALDQIRFEKPLPLNSFIAYSEKGEISDLTGKINPSGMLEWKAPSGNWTLYGLFEGWHGKMAERAGPGGEGDVIDHFSGKAIDDFLKHFDTVFKDYDIGGLRGYFNDSYEVDDASGQANWTDSLFQEFRKRRGYELRDYLPALFQKDIPEKNSGVLSDYRQTISELILEKFTEHWRAWADNQGKITRNQAHGSPGNILDLYAASDIPETEGYELTKVKFASSASNVTGKKYTSCEAATWLNEHFSSSLADVRKAADLFFLGGINHLFFHGTCFSPKNEPWPGFLFYAATEFTPANSFWNDFKALNEYIARIQSFMQKGRADNDILLYFPIYDRYADFRKGLLEHFDAINPAYEGTPFKTAAEKLPEMGYSYDYISDMQISRTNVSGNLLRTEGNTYKTIILPGCKFIPAATFENIIRLANDGASIIIYGNLPENVSGWADIEKKERYFRELKEKLVFKATGEAGISEAITGKGRIIMGADPGALLQYAGIRREQMVDKGINFMRRESETGSIYFIKNSTGKDFQGWLPLQSKGISAAIFNPMTGQYGTAGTRRGVDGNMEVFIQMIPEESLIIETSLKQTSGKSYLFYEPASVPVALGGTWNLEFKEGGPVLPEQRKLEKLLSWTETGGEDVKNFSGTAIYRTTFKKPSGKADAWILNLGEVYNSAQIIFNGKYSGTLIGPRFSIVIDKKMMKQSNTLEIRVSNLMANRIAYMDRNKIIWKKFYNINIAARLKENLNDGIFDASNWEPRTSGLLGPVTITPELKIEN